MSELATLAPELPGGWRYRDVVAAVLTLLGLLMLGIGVGSGYVSPPFVAFGALPFALGLAHLWHVARTNHAGASQPAATSSHRTLGASDEEDDPVALLKARYAAGELDDDELDRRLERLVELDELEATDERVLSTLEREE